MARKKDIALDSQQLGPSARKLYEFLHDRVKGQDESIRSLARAVDYWQSGLRDAKKPIHSALIVGPSGSGKTLLIRALAEHLFGSPDAFTEVSCCRFEDTHLSQKYIDNHHFRYLHDSDPGIKKAVEKYNGLVTEISAIEKMPSQAVKPAHKEKLAKLYAELDKAKSEIDSIESNLMSIIVFDHIENARGEMQDFISEMLENGKVLLSNGQMVHLNNAFVFVTSNDFVTGREKGFRADVEIGGFRPKEQISHDPHEKGIYLRNWEQVKSYYTPRFLGCVDRTYIFRELEEKARAEIFDDILFKFQKKLATEHSIDLSVSEEVKKFIVREASDELTLGARLIQSKFDKYIGRPIGRMKNCRAIRKKDKLVAVLSNDAGEDGKKEVIFKKTR